MKITKIISVLVAFSFLFALVGSTPAQANTLKTSGIALVLGSCAYSIYTMEKENKHGKDFWGTRLVIASGVLLGGFALLLAGGKQPTKVASKTLSVSPILSPVHKLYGVSVGVGF